MLEKIGEWKCFSGVGGYHAVVCDAFIDTPFFQHLISLLPQYDDVC